ncbi:response regulator [Mucilaginibacter sp.]|jgi:CheY-like chemotaxis protein|uniref:response regulator n=1 Tax=Mucilaginibacter sp. TaxID=1882438 RepID=UPI002C731182|nr:response regulator [Mucilaginibacter sp.]HTI57703.1 response regulator [Mucilaginibacter sp.]
MSKLILIDDEAIFHKIVQMTLKHSELSNKATYSMDGEAVLDYLEEKSSETTSLPDYIFIDLYMPRFSGWDFLNRFQKIYQNLKKNVNIYIVSSSIDPRDIDRSKTYPFATTFISKPVMKEVFDGISMA